MENFEPKNVYFLETPQHVVQSLLGPSSFKRRKRSELKEVAAGLFRECYPSSSDLLIYETDTIPPPSFYDLKRRREDSVVLGRLNRLRRIIFELLARHDVPAVLVHQPDLIPYKKEPHENEPLNRGWEDLADVSRPLTQILPTSKETWKLKLGSCNLAPLNLHLGQRGAVASPSSPFLAEEHVYRTDSRVASFAPDRTGTPTLFKSLPGLAPDLVVRALWQAMQGCSTLHAQGLIHNDVKPGNIFYDPKQSQLFDFEFAERTPSLTRILFGSPAYSDRLMHTSTKVTPDNCFAGDTFSFGMSLGVAFTRDEEWAVYAPYGRGTTYCFKSPDLKDTIHALSAPPALKELMVDMTLPKREDRVSLAEATARLGSIYQFEESKV